MHPRAFFSSILLALPLACQPPHGIAQQTAFTPPLHTSGHQILDFAGKPVRLTSVNWYGFDEDEYVAGGLDMPR